MKGWTRASAAASCTRRLPSSGERCAAASSSPPSARRRSPRRCATASTSRWRAGASGAGRCSRNASWRWNGASGGASARVAGARTAAARRSKSLAVEEARALEVGGVQLDLRLDRIDRLEDGGELLLDYKTGQAPGRATGSTRGPTSRSFRCMRSPATVPPDGLAFARVARGECAFAGLAQRADIAPDIELFAPAKGRADDWPKQLDAWRQTLACAGRAVPLRPRRGSIPSAIRARATPVICARCAGSRTCSVVRSNRTTHRTRRAEVPPRRPLPNEQQLSLLFDEPVRATPSPTGAGGRRRAPTQPGVGAGPLLHRPGAGRLGQDRAADPAVPGPARAGGQARGGHRHHLHPQGRRRDAQPRPRGAARGARGAGAGFRP